MSRRSSVVTILSSMVPLLLLALACLAGAGCAARGDVTILKAALSQNPSEPQVRAVQLFADLVDQGTEGRIRVQIYPNNQLGNQRDVVEGLQMGSIELANIASVMASFVPETNLFELPFLFDGPEHFDAVMDSSIGRGLAPAFERRGLHLLGYFDVGERHIMTTARAVERLEDLGGLKIRVMENPLHLATFEAFGASPLPMAYGELYTALQQGVIDGAEAADPNYFAKRFYEPAPFWARVGWIRLIEYVVMSRSFYDGLAAADREVIDRAARDMIVQQRAWYRAEAEAALERLRSAGVTISIPDREPFRAAAQDVYREWAERVGGMEAIEAILALGDSGPVR
ncbi:MAG: TRAP transporter substrate-binding protein [Acidobacteriota bacterium]|jgi:tripartite ATP-independent transporter DctP family solute receptor